jgi:Family of unknown function (DUF5309)
MGAVTTADQVVREDLSNLFINLDVRKTPFLSRLKRGEDLQNVKLFSWALEKYDGRMIVGIPENKDADEFETDKQDQLYNRSQKFWRRPHVTVEANTINKAPADFGKYNKQVVKKVEEQKRDIEMRLLSDADSRDDDGVTGREFMALGRFVNDGVSVGVSGAALTFGDTQTAIPVDWRTPTAQIYVGALYVLTTAVVSDLTFNEETLNGMLQNRWDALGENGMLSGFVDAALKRHLGRVFRYAKNLTNYTPLSRAPLPPVAAGNWMLEGVDIINTDFGNIDINMIAWLPRTSAGALSGRGYFLDMEFMALRASGLYLTHQMQEDKGAGPRGLIQSILGPMWGDPRGHLKIDPNVINTGS